MTLGRQESHRNIRRLEIDRPLHAKGDKPVDNICALPLEDGVLGVNRACGSPSNNSRDLITWVLGHILTVKLEFSGPRRIGSENCGIHRRFIVRRG